MQNIEVEIWRDGKILTCSTFETQQQPWSIQQLAFFVSNLRLINDKNTQTAILGSSPWQAENVVLIKPYLPDCATNSAADVGIAAETLTSNHNLQFLAPVDLDHYQQLSFTLAVPFELNHENPLQQPSPLNLPSMFWSWRAGHKFFRLDMQGPSNNWAFHLGSVGCTAASTMRTPENECVQPNRVSFKLPKKADGTKLVLHLDRLIANTPMQSDDSCLFHQGQQSCATLMSNLQNHDVFEWH
ncbi:MbnP family copper-binding protein [uncultured Paraglaciecola sp.]|uniref:MbnP family copper-binding protein n=1 Tax=uncultured Paraglaciecola sp. TaxID=1765024 RepID=UPI00262E2A78|nr:MbnP family copper-binding protein [uncultured Paraglaciecola sp.]